MANKKSDEKSKLVNNCTAINKRNKRCCNEAIIGNLCKYHDDEKNGCADPYCSEITRTNKKCTLPANVDGFCTKHYNMRNPTLTYEDCDDDICIEKTSRGRCTYKKKIGKLCTKHHNLQLKKDKLFVAQKEPAPGTKVTCCSSPSHKCSGSQYIREKVPIEKFQKVPGDNTNLYSLCSECREYGRNVINNRRKKLQELNKGLDLNTCKHKACQSLTHNVKGVSIYPRDKVPLSQFPFRSKNSKQLSKTCRDCKEYQTNSNKKQNSRKTEKAIEQGKFFCKGCVQILDKSQQSIKLDGNLGKYCIACKEKSKEYNDERYKKIAEIFKTIRHEMILLNECSCERCKCIILKPKEGNNYVEELQTYENGEKRYVDYKGKTYLTVNFLEEFDDLLEYRTLELDHISEEEQRERGIIDEDEAFIEKKGCVSSMDNEYDMRKEAEITQLLCCKCHLIITISREDGEFERWSNDKIDYIKKLKTETGCSCCGYKNPDLLRYFECHHLDPTEKIGNISNMMRAKNYTLQDIKDEIAKCIILCRACHKIHTSIQKKEGIL